VLEKIFNNFEVMITSDKLGLAELIISENH